MRHGKSSWDDLGAADHDRSLTKRGKRDSGLIGDELCHRGTIPDLIISSTAKRARSTASRVAKACNYSGEISYSRSLYHGDVHNYLLAAAGLGDWATTALIVGHNPVIEDLVHLLTGTPTTVTTANVFCIDLPIDEWSLLRLTTRGFCRYTLLPKSLRMVP